jgi:formamidopyrimidine-DNA glycosylase
MPELPEVETVRRGLADLLPGRTITAVQHDWAKSFPNAATDVRRFVVGAHITEVKRRAKILLIELDTNYTLLVHLKMTGQLVYRADDDQRFGAGHPNNSLVGELPDKSTRVTLKLNGAQLFFNDQRKFGWMKLFPTVEVFSLDFMKKLGPEPLSTDFTAADFGERLMRRAKSGIKAVLLDQTVVAGVGNIYADEALWGAKIHPETKVRDISATKITQLYLALRDVLQLSIKKGGSSDRNYVDAKGQRGSYLKFAKVFRREGLECPRCGQQIIKIRVAGRGTHICPHCQKVRA